MMMANRLEDELQEAIQRYADKHWNGALEMDKITIALSITASRYIAEIPQTKTRIKAFNIFIDLTARNINERVPIYNAQKSATG